MASSSGKAKTKPWAVNWKKLRELGGGGQGDTFIVKRLDGTDENEYVLKVLRKQTDPERRQRMYREVEALRRLQHTAVPKFIESNTDQYKDSSVPLYFVAEYVKGQTLEERVNQAPLQPTDALRLTIQLCDILMECHDKGVLHRDIKPDNVLLRGVNAIDPILIDFGLSFNRDDTNDSPVTPDGQQLGNRFLHLPELQSADSPKRNVESEISQVCGLFFYTITGKPPETLTDEQDRKPHQRPSTKGKIDDIGSPLLVSLFDKGFEHVFSSRFRSFDAFKGRLHELLDEFSPPNAFDHDTSALAMSSSTTEVKIADRHNGVTASDENIANPEQPAIMQEPFFSDENADAVMFASLLGAWNEKVEGDREVIAKLIEND